VRVRIALHLYGTSKNWSVLAWVYLHCMMRRDMTMDYTVFTKTTLSCDRDVFVWLDFGFEGHVAHDKHGNVVFISLHQALTVRLYRLHQQTRRSSSRGIVSPLNDAAARHMLKDNSTVRESVRHSSACNSPRHRQTLRRRKSDWAKSTLDQIATRKLLSGIYESSDALYC
jgi:hypothetical protein